MIQVSLFVAIGILCFLISFLNIKKSDRYHFSRLIGIVSFFAVFLTYIVPEEIVYLVAMVWDCFVIWKGTMMALGRYNTILLLYLVMMVSHFYQWSHAAAGSEEFYNTYIGILCGLNAIQLIMLLGLSDGGWNFIIKVRDRYWYRNDNRTPHRIKPNIQQVK